MLLKIDTQHQAFRRREPSTQRVYLREDPVQRRFDAGRRGARDTRAGHYAMRHRDRTQKAWPAPPRIHAAPQFIRGMVQYLP